MIKDLIIALISFAGGILSRVWFEQPKVSIQIDKQGNRTFFHTPVDTDKKIGGTIEFMEKVIVQIWMTISNKGAETEISDGKLRIKIDNDWTEWSSFSENYEMIQYGIPSGPALGMGDSILGRNKKLIIGKNRKCDDAKLVFEFPYLVSKDTIAFELMIIPVKGKSAQVKGKICRYPYKKD